MKTARATAVALASLAAVAALATPTAAAPADARPLPAHMADTGGGSQLITVEGPAPGSSTGRLTWWDRRGHTWVAAGSAPARFGSNGLTDGAMRKQGTSTTPTGLYDLPYAFGNAAAPRGTTYPYRRATAQSWWCEDNASRSYNRWAEALPADCRASESEHLADYATQYAHAVVIGFNYAHPVHGRGAGIFLHVNGKGATAGCVSVPADAMTSVLTWLDGSRHPHIAIGTKTGTTAVTAY